MSPIRSAGTRSGPDRISIAVHLETWCPVLPLYEKHRIQRIVHGIVAKRRRQLDVRFATFKKRDGSISAVSMELGHQWACYRSVRLHASPSWSRPSPWPNGAMMAQRFPNMAKCSVCGAETALFNSGTPICVKCDNILDQKAKQDKSGAVPESVLYEQTRIARAEYERLSEWADHQTKLARDITPYAD